MNAADFRVAASPGAAISLFVAACAPLLPLDFDGKPVKAAILVALFDRGVLAVQHGDSSARVIVERTVEEPRDAAIEHVSLRVGNEPLVRPSRFSREQPDCDASVRRNRASREQAEVDGIPAVAATMPCLTTFRAEFRLARPPTVRDSLYVVTRDGRARLATWYHP